MRLPLEKHDNGYACWRDSEPFVENKSGILIHRPRRVTMHKIGDKWPAHMAVGYWCGQTTVGKNGKLAFLSAPPKDSLLCEACEARAVMAGLPSAAEIAGRHVHIGKLKAVRTCCKAGA